MEKLITAKFVYPTNYRGSRIKLNDTYTINGKKSVTLDKDYESYGVCEQAKKYLKSKGATIIACGETEKYYWFAVPINFYL